MADQPIVTELKDLLTKHAAEDWSGMLEDSITEARDRAIRAKVPDAESLPDSLAGDNGYFEFLNKAVVLIPREDYPRETFYVLARFYWLLDQPSGLELQKYDEFNAWLRHFADEWGSFLNTPESAAGIQSFIDDPAFNAREYMPPPSGYLTFNQFFGREVLPGLRPVAGSFNDDIIVSPADSIFKAQFDIDPDDTVTIKHTHKYKIEDLLEGSPFADEFRGGLFWHAFLGPNDYHRFRAPVRGKVLECRAIQQNVYLQVVIKKGEFVANFDAPDDAGYEFTQTRGLIVFGSPIGLVAVLPIGMAQVSSVNMTAVEGAYLNKGEEFGYFLFGGSDIIILLQKDANTVMTAAPGIHYNAGMAIGEVR
jgi:phosphatidylserine decarboxylase precursor